MPPARLVAANGWIEVSVVCAALLGAVFGGLLIGPWLRVEPLGVLLAVYGLAGVLNVGIPASGASYPAQRLHPLPLVREFWRDADGGLSLAVTTIFWGVGATLQFAVLRWAGEVLALPLSQAASLQAAVALGVIGGAVFAARRVPLARAKRVLGAGVALGLMMPVVAAAPGLVWAVAGLVVVGVVGGILVVPLNALLQHRGHCLLSAGRSIAVQGFNENASVLAMLAVYAALVALDVGVVTILWGLGLSVAAAIAGLMRRERQRRPRAPRAARVA